MRLWITLLCVLCSSGACGGSQFEAGEGTGGSTSGGSATTGSGGSPSSGGTGTSGSGATTNSGGSTSGGAASGGTGGSYSTGGANSTGGATTSPCDELRREYMAELEQARSCDPEATFQQCSPETTLPGACSCPVPVNAENSHYEAAVQSYEEFSQAGCRLAECELTCMEGSSVICQVSAAGGSVCEWTVL